MLKVNFLLLVFFLSNSQPSFSQSQEINNSFISWDSTKYKYSFEENKDRLDKIFEVIKKQSDSSHYANYYRRLGTLYKNNGNYKTAIKYFIREAEINLNTGNILASASNTNQIGVVYYRLGEKQKALTYFHKAYNLYKGENSNRGIASAAVNISETYLDIDNIELAIKFAKEGITTTKEWGDTSEIDYNYHSLGIIYLKQKQYDSALKYFKKAENIYPSNHDYKSLIQTLNSKGNLFIAQNNIDSALFNYYQALDTSIKYQHKPFIAQTYSYLSKVHEEKGDYPVAFHYLKKLKSLDSTLLDSSTVKYITDAETRYRTREKDSKITEQKQQIKLSNLRSVIISIVSLVIILIAVILLITYRNKRKAALKEAELQRTKIDDLLQKQEVENVNAMLKGQDEERKRIAQELHDRIGSILSTVKLHFSNVEDSIKALQAQQNQSYSEAVGLLDEAVDEVRRISHDLYEGSLAKFGFSTALRQLITAIEKANSIKIEFIENGIIKNSYKNIEQDLYRITQELLSNTLKYANAKHIIIQVSQQNQTLTYMYEDDGKGFSPSQTDTSTGIGYKNIEARVAKINGKWFLDTQPNHGMTLTIEIALHHEKN